MTHKPRGTLLGLAVLTIYALSAGLQASDWPAYKADAARSGATAQELAFPLAEAWAHRSTRPPCPAWPEPGREMHRIDFDYAFQPVAAGGLVFFGSSADDTVRALDASTGELKWRFTTGGPVRFAPHIADGKCYVASDDGVLYCLNAATGGLVWQFRAAPQGRWLCGNDRVISRWPCRSGVLVADGMAYVTAGMWPSEGVYVYALDAKTGKQIWCNDTSGAMYMPYPHGGAYAVGGVAPQGYLLASEDVLLVPTGRSVPAAFDRRTGRFLYYHAAANKSNGGCWATIAGGVFLNPGHGGGPDRHVKFGERRREAGPQPGDSLLAHHLSSGGLAWGLAGRHRVVVNGDMLYAVGNGAAVAVTMKGGVPGQAKWSAEHPRAYCVARSRNALLIGGKGSITALSLADGKQAWQGKVEGKVRGIAIASGRVLGATDRGTIYCFGARRGTGSGPSEDKDKPRQRPPGSPAPGPADDIVRRIQATGFAKGYVLVVGEPDARLAENIADRTRLHVIAALTDASKVTEERGRLLDRGRVYGSRIVVHHVPNASKLPYAQYFANVVVVSGKAPESPAADLYRVLRPCGGLVVFAGMDRAAIEGIIERAPVPASEVHVRGQTVEVVRGKLPGAFDWDSEVTCDHRLRSPLELLWFGGPGPDRMVNRHWGARPPLPANGRCYFLGEYHLIAVDAYNGCELWSREIGQGFGRNVAASADDDGVYVNYPGNCLQLNARTGSFKTLHGEPQPSEQFTLDVPQSFTLDIDGQLSGKATMAKTASGLEITLETIIPGQSSGSESWELYFDLRPPGQRTFSYGPGAFAEIVRPADASWAPGFGTRHPVPTLERRERAEGTCVVYRLAWDQIRTLIGRMPSDFRFAISLKLAGPREQVATASKFADGGAGLVGNGWARILLDGEHEAEIAALTPGDLSKLPAYARKHGRRPRRTDASFPQTRVQPLTAGESSRTYRRAYGCGRTISSAHMDFFRSGTIGYYDLANDSGLRNFAGARPGCGITMIPALGVLVAAEGAAACTCSYNYHTSLALAPAEQPRNEDWAVFHDQLPMGSIRRAALNLGAPGDRRAQDVLWLGVPRPQAGLNVPSPQRVDLPVPFRYSLHEDVGRPYRVNADRVTIAGTDRPWLYTSGLKGLESAEFDLEIVEPGLVCWPAGEAPQIDGRLDEPCWTGCKSVAVAPKTKMSIRHDKDNLYMAYERRATISRRGVVTPWRAATKGDDAPVWQDDSCELFLSDGTAQRCLHLGLSASGARYDARWNYDKPVFPTYEIPRLLDVEIDGDGDEWAGMAWEVHSLTGLDGAMRPAKDFDVHLQVGWDEQGVLLLVEVQDDTIVEADDAASLWEGDSVQIWMLPRRGAAESFCVTLGTGADPKRPGMRVAFGDYRKVASGEPLVKAAGQTTEDGYRVEVLLSWQNFPIPPSLERPDSEHPDVGHEVGLQVYVNDYDGTMGPSEDWFQARWHPGGPPNADAAGCHSLRLAEDPGPPIEFKRGEIADESGLLTAQRPYPYPLCATSLGSNGEDSGYDCTWAGAVVANDTAFLAELAVPWKTLADAGLDREQLLVGIAGRGPLRAAPAAGRGFEHLILIPEAKGGRRSLTVRLHFAELESVTPGTRVFDILLQGKVVLKDFDIVKEAGGPRRAVVKEFRGIDASEALAVMLTPEADEVTDMTVPILSGVEVAVE